MNYILNIRRISLDGKAVEDFTYMEKVSRKVRNMILTRIESKSNLWLEYKNRKNNRKVY